MNTKIQELIVSLQKEYLFIHNEKVDINKLFNDIQAIYDELYKKNYVLNSQQLLYIESFDLIHTQANVKNFFLLESKIAFIKLNSVLIQYEYHFIELFKLLSNETQLLADILLISDEKCLNVPKLCKIVYNSILGSAITSIDSNKVLSILSVLVRKQFSTSKDPQKVIISGKCAFIRLFKFYVDNLTTAKTFLVSTLQEPIEYIIMNDDMYLDISSKITKERMFTDSNSKYHDKFLEYRQTVVNRIAEAVNLFIKKLTDSFAFLPENYVYIVNSLFKALNENKNLRRIDVLKTCIDFIFDCFIYPAMLNPEYHGIIGDFPLSSISKHNLIEIGKIIKHLIYEEINKNNNVLSFESRSYQTLPADLLERFEEYSLNSLITELSIWSEKTKPIIEVDFSNSLDNSIDLNRTLSLISEAELYFLLKILKFYTIESNMDNSQLSIIINRIGSVDPDNYISKCVINRGTDGLISNLKESGETIKSRLMSKYDDVDITYNTADLNILILVINPFIECPGMQPEDKIINELKCRTDSINSSIKDFDKSDILHHSEGNSASMSSMDRRDSRRDSSSSRSCFSSGETSIHTTSRCRKPKMSSLKDNENLIKMNDSTNIIDDIPVSSSEVSRKRTHFNVQEFAGSVLDLVEGIFDVASTHSIQSEDVDSRFDLDDNNEQNKSNNNSEANAVNKGRNFMASSIHQLVAAVEHDPVNNGDTMQSISGSLIPNLSVTDLEDLRAGTGAGIDDGSSDLIYWQNISGRDTPSMSGGRDSPSSSVGGSDLPNNVKPDVTEKFCKFDIPKTVEARSTVSDTWSTDVLASDSETTEQIENRRLVEIQEENHPYSYSQRASESEDNSENVNSTKPIFSEKVVVIQTNQSSIISNSKDSNIPSIQLETTMSGYGVKFKSNTSIRTINRSNRNYGSLIACNGKDEDKTIVKSNISTVSPISGSPSTVRKGLVDKIRDRFSNTKIRKDSKCNKIEKKVDADEVQYEMKLDEGALFDPESIEEMLVRYGSKTNSKPLDFSTILNATAEDESPAFFDPKTAPETWPAWKVSKIYLRTILQKICIKTNHEKLLCSDESNNNKHPLIQLLQICLAEANLLQEDYILTQLEETLRIIQLFDNESITKMMSSMIKELKKRKVYITYLVNTHSHLRLIKKRAEELLLRMTRSCQMTSRSMISICIHEILREQNSYLESFFKTVSSRAYEENNSVSNLMKSEIDYSKFSNEIVTTRSQAVTDVLDWASRILNSQSYLPTMTSERQHETRVYLERMVMSQLHRFSITLNDDIAELDRDNVFHRELESLKKTISPFQLSIHKKFHCLIPFESAQKELLKINCYKTPRDKVSCIQKTTHKIAVLLKMTKHDCIPGADDILPVLIYVIIAANPPRLLSNMSYIETLCATQLEGQNQYMWCQFTAAVNEVRRLLTLHPIVNSKM